MKFYLQNNHPFVARVIYDEQFKIITEDEDNPQYQQYLAWLAEGNTPEEWNPDAN